MVEVKKGMVATLLEALATGKEYTIEEMVALSGASIGTVKMQVNYLLVKNGHAKEVKKNVVDGVTKYSIVK
jgi:hypothetical protein